MMVTVCINTDACLIICIHQSWFIWCQQLPSVLLDHHQYLLQPVLTDCNSLFPTYTCIILLHQTDTALTTQQTVPVWYVQLYMISYLCIRPEVATGCNKSVHGVFTCVYEGLTSVRAKALCHRETSRFLRHRETSCFSVAYVHCMHAHAAHDVSCSIYVYWYLVTTIKFEHPHAKLQNCATVNWEWDHFEFRATRNAGPLLRRFQSIMHNLTMAPFTLVS